MFFMTRSPVELRKELCGLEAIDPDSPPLRRRLIRTPYGPNPPEVATRCQELSRLHHAVGEMTRGGVLRGRRGFMITIRASRAPLRRWSAASPHCVRGRKRRGDRFTKPSPRGVQVRTTEWPHRPWPSWRWLLIRHRGRGSRLARRRRARPSRSPVSQHQAQFP